MPYICLARDDIPNGVVQVLDLQPNASQPPPGTPTAQSRYVNRPLAAPVSVTAAGGLAADGFGLAAYLMDRVEPGGLEVAAATLTATSPLHGDTVTVAGVALTAIANLATGTAQMVGPTAADTVTVGVTPFTCVEAVAAGTAQMVDPADADTIDIKTVPFLCVENYAVGTATVGAGTAAGDTLVIKGVTFTAVNPGPGVPANQTFTDVAGSGTDILTADSLVAAINDPASQALILAAAPAGIAVPVADNVGGTSAVVTLTADHLGLQGEFSLVQTGGNIAVSGATMIAVVPDPAVQEFAGLLQAVGGTNIAVATSLALAVNDPASQALILAAVVPAGGAVCAAATGGTDTVTLTADLPGAQGDFALAESTAGARVTLSGAALVHVDADPATQEFNSLAHYAPAGTNVAVATSLVLALNDVANPEPVGADNAGGTLDTVTITAGNRGLVGELALAESTVGARVTISGATLVAILPVAATQEFAALAAVANNDAVATSFRTTLVDGATIALMQIVTGGPYVSAVAPGAAIITMTALDALAAALIGPTGNMQFLTSNDTRLVQDAVAAVTSTLNRAHQTWTAAFQIATTAALQARVDAGTALALGNLDTVLLAQGGGELTALAGSNSTGTVADILSILAGRGYRAPTNNDQTGAANIYMTGAATWNPVTLGGFTELVREYSANWGHGEIRSTAIGGDWVAREITPIRHTVDTDALQISLAHGTLAVFGAVAGQPPVTLWPDSDFQPFYPWTYQKTLGFPTVNNARLLTIYDDTGAVLA